MAFVVYLVEEAGDDRGHERDLFDIDAAGYLLDLDLVFVDYCSIATPMKSRSAFQRALRRLGRGDTFITRRIGSMGSTVGEIISTLRKLQTHQASIVCLDFGCENIRIGTHHPFLRTLELVHALDSSMRSERARAAAASAHQRGAPPGRPRSLSKEQQQQVLNALRAGASVTAIARSLSTSRQTIMRLRALSADAGQDIASALKLNGDPD